MSEWKRVEQPTDSAPAPATPPDLESIPAPIPVTEELAFDPAAELPPLVEDPLPIPPVAESVVPAAPAAPSPRRKQKKPSSRRNPAAAPIGFLVLVLALVGAVSILVSGFGWLRDLADDTPLKEEIAEFLEPVMLQNPTAFNGAKEAAKNASCVKAALWKVTEEERIRMRQEKDKCRFSSDDTDRLLIPEKEVNAAFAALFGEGVPDTGVFAEQKDGFSIWFNPDTRQYHLPAFAAALYQPVVDKVDKQDGNLTVEVGYVAAEDIAVDERGNDIPPTPAQATVFQTYTLKETADGYQLLQIADAVAR